MNRTTVVLNLADNIANLLNYPVLLDFSRLSRVWESYVADDKGYGQPLECTSFDGFSSGLAFMGWQRVPNNLSIPDYMYDVDGNNAGGYNDIAYGLIGLGGSTGLCVQTVASAFTYVGSPWVEGITPGFDHGLIAGCAIGRQGFYQCVHGMSENSVLPNQHVQIWPSGSFFLPKISFPFFTSVTWEGSTNWKPGPYAVCPMEWIFPPNIWQ